ncbi:hypothetical protein VM57_11330 [Stenotrophomonas maltophilia]|uniref:Uncharacterized protein n=1 Tax=Stenotrophomonas maltophilia TaxID=40324 RepID=A0A0F5ZND3_STEMA|nr:hypothetical protein VM57_11330 [Stenotrophomonas maltophilia]
MVELALELIRLGKRGELVDPVSLAEFCHVGGVNKAFGSVYKVRLKAKALRERSVVAYQLIKWGLVGGGDCRYLGRSDLA